MGMDQAQRLRGRPIGVGQGGPAHQEFDQHTEMLALCPWGGAKWTLLGTTQRVGI